MDGVGIRIKTFMLERLHTFLVVAPNGLDENHVVDIRGGGHFYLFVLCIMTLLEFLAAVLYLAF